MASFSLVFLFLEKNLGHQLSCLLAPALLQEQPRSRLEKLGSFWSKNRWFSILAKRKVYLSYSWKKKWTCSCEGVSYILLFIRKFCWGSAFLWMWILISGLPVVQLQLVSCYRVWGGEWRCTPWAWRTSLSLFWKCSWLRQLALPFCLGSVCCLLKTMPLPEGWDEGLTVEELGSSYSLAISILETMGPFMV